VTRFVEVGDIEVALTERGDGPRLVLLHGLAEDVSSWSGIQDRLPGLRTTAVDLRGHGATTAGAGDGTLAQLSGDLIGLLEQGIGPAAVAGFSLGGTIVLEAAAARPDLVTRPIAIATSSVVGRAAVEFFERRIAQLESGDREGFAAGLAADTAAQVASGADVSVLTAQRLEAVGDGRGYVNAALAMCRLRNEPLTPRLASISHHVDLIGGSEDAFCPRRAAEIMLDALPDATFHEIAGAGHLIAVDRPAELAALLDRFPRSGGGS
jgi:pimeloyl-ACP methyl ester carboxylesterase